jgi:hypothetical protein
MIRWQLRMTALVLGLLVSGAGMAQAGRTPTTRTSGEKSSGARTDITVPYTTTGKSAFMSGSVAPRIYSSQSVDDRKNPGARPVYNLIYYGAKQGYGDKSNGATPKPTLGLLRLSERQAP